MKLFKAPTLLLFLFALQQITAQINDLSQLSQGEFTRFSALFDNEEELFGYVAQFSLGETAKNEFTFEVAVYDKNLNRLFVQSLIGDKSVEDYSLFLNAKNELIASPNINLGSIGIGQAMKGSPSKVYKINTSTGQLSNFEIPCFIAGELMDCSEMSNKDLSKKMKAHKKKTGFFEDGIGIELIETGNFLVTTRRTKNYQTWTNNQIRMFDDNNEELWSFEYNKKAKKNKYEKARIINYTSKEVNLLLKRVNKKKTELFYKVIDATTGKVVISQPIEGLSSEAIDYLYSSKSNMIKKTKNEQSVISAAIIEGKKNTTKGVFVAFIDETNQLNYKVIDFKTHLSNFIDQKIQKKGTIDGYNLYPLDVLLNDDGSFRVLSEMMKYEFSVVKNRIKSVMDIYVMEFDQQLNLQHVDVIEKNKSKQERPGYMYSQKIADLNNTVFFYKDYVADENAKKDQLTLFINSYQDNQLQQDKLQLSSMNGDYKITPFVAKSGYILLHEYNKEEQRNQIRLERLNMY